MSTPSNASSAPQTMFLSVRVRNGNDDEMYEVDAGLPNLYQVADLLRSLAQSIGDHAEAMESGPHASVRDSESSS